MHFGLASSRILVTILTRTVFRDAALVRGKTLIRGRCLFQCGYPKVQCLFEA